jgi:hypothetical protein
MLQMKRLVSKTVRLSPFSIGLGDLSLLWTRLDALFPEEEKSFYVDVEFAAEKLTMETLEELKGAKYPKAKATTFTLHCHGAEHSLHLFTPPHSGSRPLLEIRSNSEVWIAGAREVVLTIINHNRTWYHWLANPSVLPVWGAAVISASAGYLATQLWRGEPTHFAAPLSVVTAALAVGVVLVGSKPLFPQVTLRLVETESTLRRYSVELTLLFAAISAVLAGFSLIVPK